MGEETSDAQIARTPAHSTVLIVEDEGLIRVFIADYLRGCGLGVLEAECAEDAKTMFIAGEPIDVVFSDVQLSSGPDGMELALWVRRNYPDVHVMLTSGVATLTEHSPCAFAPQHPPSRSRMNVKPSFLAFTR